MDGEQYYAAAKRLGLHPTGTPNVYVNAMGDVYSVPNPADYTVAQREEIIEKLKERMGITPADER